MWIATRGLFAYKEFQSTQGFLEGWKQLFAYKEFQPFDNFGTELGQNFVSNDE